MKYLLTLLCLTTAVLLSLAASPPLPDDVRRCAALLYVGIAMLQALCVRSELGLESASA